MPSALVRPVPLYFLVLVCIVAAYPSLLLADIPELPIGHDEALRANTGIGSYNSATGVILNPASIAGIEQNSLSTSGSTFLLLKASGSGSQGSTSIESISSIPHTLISIWKLENSTLGMSLLTPENFNVAIKYRYSEPETNTSTELEQLTLQQRNLAGLSYALPLNERWSLGASAFLGYATTTEFAWRMSRFSQASQVNANNGKASTLYLSSVLGATWKGSDISLGVRIEPPARLLSSDLQGGGAEQLAIDSNGSTTVEQKQLSPYVSYPSIPQWSVGFGLEAKLKKNWTTYFDISADEVHQSVDGGAASNSDTRISLGSTYEVSDTWAWLAGLNLGLGDVYRDRTGKLRDTDPVEVETALTTGLSRRSENFETNVGLLYTRIIEVSEARQPTDFVISNSSVQFWGVLFSGLYRY